MALLREFLFFPPLLVVIVAALTNSDMVTVSVLGYKITCSLGWVIGVAGCGSWLVGLLSAWDSMRRQTGYRLSNAKRAGQLNSLFSHPDAVKEVEAIFGRIDS
jgi:hypothetical protein